MTKAIQTALHSWLDVYVETGKANQNDHNNI